MTKILRKYNLFALTAVLFATLKAAATTPLQEGDEVRLTRDEALRFREAVFQQAKEGDTFTVLAHRPEAKKVFVSGKDKEGKQIALSIPDDAVSLIPVDATSARENALSAASHGKLNDSIRLLDKAIRSNPTDASLEETRLAVVELQRATSQLAAAKEDLKRITIEAARKRNNAAITDRPNLLIPNDDSNRVRAQGVRTDADVMVERGKKRIAEAESELRSALAALWPHQVSGSTRVASKAAPEPNRNRISVPMPGRPATAPEVSRTKEIQNNEPIPAVQKTGSGHKPLNQWTDDPEIVPAALIDLAGEPSYNETLDFINRKLKATGRRLWYGERTKRMILSGGDRVIIFDPASCSPEVTYSSKEEKREFARYPMAGFGLPPVMDMVEMMHSQILIRGTDGKEEVEFCYASGTRSTTDKLYLQWENSIDPDDLKKLANAFRHLISLFGGRPDAF